MIKRLIVWLGACVLAACATDYRPTYFYNEIYVINDSRESIRDLTVSVSDSGRQFNCARIAPKGFCSNRFPNRRYVYQPIRVDWTFGDEERRTDSFVVDVPLSLLIGRPLRAVVDIDPEGRVKAYFEQVRPIRDDTE